MLVGKRSQVLDQVLAAVPARDTSQSSVAATG
jgi:hypothetical protein